MKKTYPQFWDDLEGVLSVGLSIPEEGNMTGITGMTGNTGINTGINTGMTGNTGINTGITSSTSSNSTRNTINNSTSRPRSRTVVVIGMRGAGKTTTSKAASALLSRAFIDMDALFERRHSEGISTFVEREGWAVFREKEAELLKEVLLANPFDTIVACGGGVVESEEAQKMLKKVRY